MKLLIIFTILSILNVIFSTIKSLVTVKGSPMVASLTSALYYGLYNIVLIYTVADFPLWQKVAVTFTCNLVGVYAVKWAEVKARKDRLWKVEATIKDAKDVLKCMDLLNDRSIPFSYVDITKYVIFNCYCATQKESAEVKKILEECNAKYFVSESKEL